MMLRQYDFTFMDSVVKRLADNDIQIMLATPSAARPRWLAEKYPEAESSKEGSEEV